MRYRYQTQSARLINDYITARGLTQTEFANMVGVSPPVVTDWVRYNTRVSESKAEKIEAVTKGAIRKEQLCPNKETAGRRDTSMKPNPINERSPETEKRLIRYDHLLSRIGHAANAQLLQTYLDDGVITDPWSKQRALYTIAHLKEQAKQAPRLVSPTF